MQFQHIDVTYFKSYAWELHPPQLQALYIYIYNTISFASNSHHVNPYIKLCYWKIFTLVSFIYIYIYIYFFL